MKLQLYSIERRQNDARRQSKTLGSMRTPHTLTSYENGKYFKFVRDLCWENFDGIGTFKQSKL